MVYLNDDQLMRLFSDARTEALRRNSEDIWDTQSTPSTLTSAVCPFPQVALNLPL
jgi:hypothetical protein